MVETACVSFPRIALEYFDKLVCQHCRLPGFTRNHGFGNCQAHLCIISIATRLDVMPGMFHITGKVIMQANRLCVYIFKTSSICIANSKFKQQVVLSPSRRIVKQFLLGQQCNIWQLLAVIMNGVLLVTASWNGPHKWVILRMTPTALLSYHSCKKHQGARASSTLLEGFDPVGNVNTVMRNNVC